MLVGELGSILRCQNNNLILYFTKKKKKNQFYCFTKNIWGHNQVGDNNARGFFIFF
jgi:hypothetical protein